MKQFILCILLALGAFELSAQSLVFHGRFASLADGEEIMYARITNSAGIGRLTNSNGYVEIPVIMGETLVVTHVSYDTFEIKISPGVVRDTGKFYLIPRTYELQSITYSILGPRKTFDNRFIGLELEKTDEEKVKEKLKIEDMKSDLVALDAAAQDGVVLGSPITALYDQFSKAAAERRKYEALVRQDLIDSLNAKKFNENVISMLTEFNADEIEAFIRFCSFHEDFINQSTPLELYIEVLRCKQQYLAIKED